MTLPLAIEDLRVGMWIVISGRKLPTIQVQVPDGNLMQMVPTPVQIYEPDGVPLKVASISLPFICVYPVLAPYHLRTIYVKTVELRRPSPHYVKTFKKQFALVQSLTNEEYHRYMAKE